MGFCALLFLSQTPAALVFFGVGGSVRAKGLARNQEPGRDHQARNEENATLLVEPFLKTV